MVTDSNVLGIIMSLGDYDVTFLENEDILLKGIIMSLGDYDVT